VPPTRQRIRYDATGRRRYLDLMWELPDGTIIILEVDGSFHLRTDIWWRDMKRERKIVVQGPTVLRCSTIEVRLDFADIAYDLRQVGVPLASKLAA
jgi:very-short-patch-repair endonuclease